MSDPKEQYEFDHLWDYDNPAATENQFRSFLPVASTKGKSYHVELLTQIARTLGLQQRFDEAHKLLDEAEALFAEDMQRPRIRYLLERGRVFNSSGSPDTAQPLFTAAWEIAQQAGEDFYAIDAAHMLAIVEQGQAALDWNLKALGLAESSNQPRAKNWLGSLYNNIGWAYHDMGQYERALGIFEKALQFREKEGKPKPIHIAGWCVARALRSLGRVEEALERQQTLLTRAEAAQDELGYTYEEIGECLLLLNREAEAKPYFARAYGVLSRDSWLVRNESGRLERLRELGS
ncbi:MAG: tetratricopeptide repeat protein [Anaerolineaceae bacterium]|nr:tetratricopeptide repeat protein [Anaerolineaceae bacterium]